MKRKPHGWLLPLLLITVAGTWLAYNLHQQQTQPEHSTEATTTANHLSGTHPRPDFTLNDINGKPHKATDWQGKVVLLNFWASWCPPCKREIPMLKELQHQYGNQGLQIIGIAIDDPERVRNYLKNTPVNYPIMVGEDDTMRVAIEYGNFDGVLPYNVIIGKDNNIHAIHMGELESADAEALIFPLLDKTAK